MNKENNHYDFREEKRGVEVIFEWMRYLA